MTARLNRIHAILRAANVPCAMTPHHGLGLVLQAGVPDGGTWDVHVRDTGTELLLQDGRGTTRLPFSASDAAAADTVKLHVVQAWANQGNPEAQALLAKLGRTARLDDQYPAGEFTETVPTQYLDLDGLSLLNPLHFAGRMFDAMNQLANVFMAPQPVPANPVTVSAVTINYRMWSPWGTIQGRYTI